MKRLILFICYFTAFFFTEKGGFAQNREGDIEGKSGVKKIQFMKTINEKGVQYPPKLTIEELNFDDDNANGVLEADENGFFSFSLINSGKGEALAPNIMVKSKKKLPDELEVKKNIQVETIYPGQNKVIYIPIKSTKDLKTGTSYIQFNVLDNNGFEATSDLIALPMKSFQAPEIIVADAIFKSNNNSTVQLNQPIYLNTLVQNIGKGDAENVVAEFVIPDENCVGLAPKIQNIGKLRSGESREIQYSFVATGNYKKDDISVNVNLTEKNGQYAESKELSVSFHEELQYINRNIVETRSGSDENIPILSLTPDVDKNIPLSGKRYPKRLALIIGNEDYQSRQPGLTDEINVAFARNDARIFKEYAINILGVEERNIFFMKDATAAEINERLKLISKIAKLLGNESEIIFYYAGHGLPDEVTKEPYLIPVDVSGGNLEAAVALKDVYTQLGNTGAKRVTIFLDACFSGGGRTTGLLATRGVRVKPKEELLPGNIVVFAASSDEQTALPYDDKQHGMFTYFLLKKLQETKGNVSYGELKNYLEQQVGVESLRVNRKEQAPKVNISNSVQDEWVKWNIR